MRRYLIAGFLLLLAFDTASQVCMKFAALRVGQAEHARWLARVIDEPLVGLVLLCYLGAFLSYISLLKHAPVGPAYAAAHGHIVTVLIISMLFLGETLTWVQALGALLIAAGITTLAVTETSADAAEPAAPP